MGSAITSNNAFLRTVHLAKWTTLAAPVLSQKGQSPSSPIRCLVVHELVRDLSKAMVRYLGMLLEVALT